MWQATNAHILPLLVCHGAITKLMEGGFHSNFPSTHDCNYLNLTRRNESRRPFQALEAARENEWERGDVSVSDDHNVRGGNVQGRDTVKNKYRPVLIIHGVPFPFRYHG